ncbi:uncharacterized protein LOC143287137 [Babylonia areolata]|uniref:uncharacterized protein LOC143287137 n=1 Tax=Babylonia areolata TaxID=304850 RepID=UPI003FD23DC9
MSPSTRPNTPPGSGRGVGSSTLLPEANLRDPCSCMLRNATRTDTTTSGGSPKTISLITLYSGLSTGVEETVQTATMDRKPPSQTLDSTTRISDSVYGSMAAQSSSSCLSLLSESDLLDDPSTSGCSSEMGSHLRSKEKKRQKVKALLKELKGMVPQQPRGDKPCTLSTLDYVVSSMRRITEQQGQERSHSIKPSLPLDTASVPLLQDTESVEVGNGNTGSDLTPCDAE